MDEYNYNYKLTIATHTYLIQTVSFIIIEGYVNHDILASLYQASVCKDAVFNHFFQLTSGQIQPYFAKWVISAISVRFRGMVDMKH